MISIRTIGAVFAFFIVAASVAATSYAYFDLALKMTEAVGGTGSVYIAIGAGAIAAALNLHAIEVGRAGTVNMLRGDNKLAVPQLTYAISVTLIAIFGDHRVLDTWFAGADSKTEIRSDSVASLSSDKAAAQNTYDAALAAETAARRAYEAAQRSADDEESNGGTDGSGAGRGAIWRDLIDARNAAKDELDAASEARAAAQAKLSTENARKPGDPSGAEILVKRLSPVEREVVVKAFPTALECGALLCWLLISTRREDPALAPVTRKDIDDVVDAFAKSIGELRGESTEWRKMQAEMIDAQSREIVRVLLASTPAGIGASTSSEQRSPDSAPDRPGQIVRPDVAGEAARQVLERAGASKPAEREPETEETEEARATAAARFGAAVRSIFGGRASRAKGHRPMRDLVNQAATIRGDKPGAHAGADKKETAA